MIQTFHFPDFYSTLSMYEIMNISGIAVCRLSGLVGIIPKAFQTVLLLFTLSTKMGSEAPLELAVVILVGKVLPGQSVFVSVIWRILQTFSNIDSAELNSQFQTRFRSN